jgi:hypothetical protein
MSKQVKVAQIPLCDINHRHGAAYADAKLSFGPWGYVCKACFDQYGCQLGTGLGQELILDNEKGA